MDHLSGEENARSLAGESEQAEGCSGGFVLSLFPTAGGSERDIKKRREYRLADVKLAADCRNSFGPNGSDGHWKEQSGDPHGDLLLIFEVIGMAPEAFQEETGVEFNLLRRMFL